MTGTAATGTVYALTDPRDDAIRYVGATKQKLATRLKGHLSTPSPKVGPWILELKDAGLTPLITPIREGVPATELRAAETEEIVSTLATGADLLNEQISDHGRQVRDDFRAARRLAAEQAGWRELADLAIAVLGGPLPPGELAELEIPDVAWKFMSHLKPGHREYADSLIGDGHPRDTQEERHRIWRDFHRVEDEAVRAVWHCMRGRWSALRGLERRDTLSSRLELCAGHVAQSPCSDRSAASRHLSLIAWCVIAVEPWRHLAKLSGVPDDDASFIAWAGRDPGTRDALEFLASRGERVLAMTSEDWTREYHGGPGRYLGTVAAAYTGTMPAAAIRPAVTHVLGKAAEDRELTSPMASLLLRLDPKALDHAYGKDVAAELDAELGLPAGTSGRVARALAGRIRHDRGSSLHNIADRSAQELPTVAVPDYGRWYGPGVPGARSVGASLVSAGLAVPDRGTPDEYLARFREFWVPSAWTLAREAA